ncbi:MAG TPA: metallophosphoesterase [Gemmatimonadaceae bacterium]|nr:metallophosphoesterase [Gemmatimonadaceae bacterium]
MRLVHLADLHLGYRQYHRLTPTGLNLREADVARAFRRAVDRIVEIRPDIVTVAGDVFHSVRPMNPAIIDAFHQFSRLVAALPDAVIVIVAGNHDRPRSTETGCILRLFSRLGIHVVDAEAQRLAFPERDLSILAVPDLAHGHAELTPDPSARHNVLLLHGEVEGVFPATAPRADRATLEISRAELGAARWSYVALGHYHVYREVAPNAFYAGSLEYVSTNPWGELVEEREAGIPGKGFIEVDLVSGEHRFHHVEPARRLVDLPQVSARGMSAAELDAAIRERVEKCDGGITDRIVRLVVRDVPRHVVRDLDHKALREYKRQAVHFHLDTRRPEIIRSSASGAPGRRPTLAETVQSYLGRRPLESGVDRTRLVSLGLHYLSEAERGQDAAGSASASPSS